MSISNEPSSVCYRCNTDNDGATDPTDESRFPREGDLSFCFRCSVIGIFVGDGLKVREPTDEEFAEFRENTAFVKNYLRFVIAKAMAHLKCEPNSHQIHIFADTDI